MMEELSLERKAQLLGEMINSGGWIKVVKPALEKQVEVAVDMWSTGRRTKVDESVSDEGLKQRVAALKWMLSWEKSYKNAVEQLAQSQALAGATEPAEEGRALY